MASSGRRSSHVFGDNAKADAAGAATGGLASGGKNHAAEIGAGAQAGKNAVENNFLATAARERLNEYLDIVDTTKIDLIKLLEQ